jgi:hypothetical protein
MPTKGVRFCCKEPDKNAGPGRSADGPMPVLTEMPLFCAVSLDALSPIAPHPIAAATKGIDRNLCFRQLSFL